MRLPIRQAVLSGIIVIVAAGVIGTLSYVATAEQLARQVDVPLLAVSAWLRHHRGTCRRGRERRGR